MQLEGGTKEALGKRISSHDMRPEGNQLVDDPTPTIYVPKVTSDMSMPTRALVEDVGFEGGVGTARTLDDGSRCGVERATGQSSSPFH